MSGFFRRVPVAVGLMLVLIAASGTTFTSAQVPGDNDLQRRDFLELSTTLDGLRQQLDALEIVALCPESSGPRNHGIPFEVHHLSQELSRLTGMHGDLSIGDRLNDAAAAEIQRQIRKLTTNIANLRSMIAEFGLSCSQQLVPVSNLAAEAAGGSISGSIIDSTTSLGLSGERVYIYDADGYYVTGPWTDSNGNYSTGTVLTAGTYYARTNSYTNHLDELYDNIPCPGWCNATLGTPISVGDGEVVTGIDFALDKGGSISGTVTDSATAAAIALGYIYVYDDSGDSVSYGYVDSNGDYTTSQGLLAGTYYARSENYSGYIDEIYDDMTCLGWCDPTLGTPIIVGAGEDVTGIDFALDKGGSISGTVTDSATAAAIALGYIYVYDDSGDYLAYGYTDSSGDYTTFQGLPAGTYYAQADYFTGYLDELYDNLPCASGCDVTTGTPIIVEDAEDVTGINFALDKGGTISGTVTDSATSTGIEGERVRIYDASGNYLTYDYTDANGEYSCSLGLPAGTYYAIAYSYSGYLNELYDNLPCASGCGVTTGTPIIVGSGEDVTGIDFALDKGGTISGSVTDASTSIALDSTRVDVYNAGGNSVTSAYTDSNGNYKTSTGLPAGTYYARTYNYSGYLNELYDNIPCASGCDVTTGTPITVGAGEDVTGIDFALDKGGTISGTVTDSETSTGIEDERVRIYNTSGSSVASAYTDSNGDFITSTGLPAGTYFARTDDYSGYLNELFDDIPCASGCDVTTGTPIAVGAGEDVTGINFALVKGGTISGTVTDFATAAAIALGYIYVYDDSGNEFAYGYIDSNGDYTTSQGLPAGTYYARTYNSSGYLDELYDDISCASGCDPTTGTPITVGAGEDVTGIDFALEKGGSISGTVTVAATSLGLGSTWVYVYDGTGNEVAYGRTDANGIYTTYQGLPAGTYYARAYNSSGYLDELYDDIACASGCDPTTGTPITVGAGEDVTGIDFALEKGGSISGTVTDAATSLGLVSTRVYIYNAGGDYVSSKYTDSNGNYTTSTGLPAGTYYARTYDYSGYLNELYDNIPCASGCDVTTGTPITVGAGEDVTGVNFALEKGGTISGTVTDAATSLGLGSTNVYVYNSSGNSVSYCYTDTNGNYTTSSGLPAGTYYARTDNYSGYFNELYDNIPCASGCSVTTGTPITVGAGTVVTGIDFALEKGGTISGRVTDALTSNGIADVYLNVYNSDGDWATDGNTDSNGNYTTNQGLPAGTYFVVTYSYWSGGDYRDQLYDGIDCDDWNCDVLAGTPIIVGEKETVTGIDFNLFPASFIFSDGFESGQISAWSTAVGGM